MPNDTDPDIDEARRLAALHSLDLLDSEPEREFDALVALAGELLGCQTAMLTLVDRDRMWVMARAGPGVSEVPRSAAFCDHTIRGLGALVVEDATLDSRFWDNPLVTAPNGLRFYAGTPIHMVDSGGERQPIGALCVADTRSRTLGVAAARALVHLSTLAESLIAMRANAMRSRDLAARFEQQAAELARRDRIFDQAERLAGIGSWRYGLEDGRLDWSEGVYRLHGLPVGDQPSIAQALDHYPPAARARIAAQLTDTIENGVTFDVEEDFQTVHGEPRRMRAIAEREVVDGRALAITGVFQDITDRHHLETALRRSAETDPLTGIANRKAFERTLDTAIARAHANNTPLALAMIDLDGFKAVNDTLGHAAGDEVLRQVAHALSQPWLRGMPAARLGGDEFALIIEDIAFAANPAAWREALEDALRVGVTANGITMASAGTVGIARLEAHHDARDLVHRADMVLYSAKRARVGDRRRVDRRRLA